MEYNFEHNSLQGVIYLNITVCSQLMVYRKSDWKWIDTTKILNNSDSAPNLNGLGINFGYKLACDGDTWEGDNCSSDNFFTELINKTTGCFWLSDDILLVILSNAATQFVIVHIWSVFTKTPKSSNFLTVLDFKDS